MPNPPDLKKDVIVTDEDKAYPRILEKMGVEQHLMCIPQSHEPKNIYLKRTTQNN